ncbi:MAG: pyrroline-5-carboxylate reductase [Clostridiales bacterium]|nr:pyrroline-5-carboxylate reductase [Clostridiales bacterium]
MKNKIRIAFIGCGNMARAIMTSMNNVSVRAAFKSNREELRIVASDCDEGKTLVIRGLCNVAKDNASAASEADYVILCVKPQDVEKAVEGVDLSQKTVISIMAGVTLETLEKLTKSTRIVRVMPNINASVGESLNAYCAKGLDGETLRVVLSILGSFGVCVEVEEDKMSAVTALSGSGPAFVFSAMKAFYDEAVARGFDEQTAKQIAVQTVIGSVLLAEKSEAGFDKLISSVCSKGGTTEAGVKCLKDNGFEDILCHAIDAAARKAEEMKK